MKVNRCLSLKANNNMNSQWLLLLPKRGKKWIANLNVKSITHVTLSFDLSEHLPDNCDPMR